MNLVADDFRELLDSSPDATVVVDATGTIVFASRQTEVIFGYQSDEMVGQPIEMLIPGRHRAAHSGYLSFYARKPRLRPMGANHELHARRRDGSEFPVEISLSPLTTKRGTLISSVIRDVTDRKTILDDLVKTRAEAVKASRGKSSFIATASHNLRHRLQTVTLLNGVLGRIVTDASAIAAVAGQREALTSVSTLLNALLDISKLESGAVRPRISDCSVQDIIQNIKATFAAQATAKGLSLVVDGADPVIRTDKGLFEQIIQNLVANAIRYTHSGTVHLRCVNEGASVRVEVADTGIGIAANQKHAIFEEFCQLDREPGEKRDGLGLGLAIVRRMAQLLGHTIDVKSEVGRGSCFAVTVPRGRPKAALPKAPTTRACPGRRESLVLVIDDDPAVAGATEMLLELEGHRVLVAASAEEAVSLAGHDNRWPDLIVADYHLGIGRSGIDAISDLRTLAARSIPAVLMTGDTSAEIASALHHLGDCAVLSKPFAPDDLLQVLAQLPSHASHEVSGGRSTRHP